MSASVTSLNGKFNAAMTSPRSKASGQFSPGRSTTKLASAQAVGKGGSGLGVGHASWVDESPMPAPSGPVHAGGRHELLQAHLALHKEFTSQNATLRNTVARLNELETTREAEKQHHANLSGTLEAQLEALTEEFNATKLTMGKEQIRLNTELSGCRNELAACSHRLSKTHEALGITADKARALESSQGRIQIDLDGTLSTLEDATRRHHDELIEADTLRKRREAELIGALTQARNQVEQLTNALNESLNNAQSLKEELARLTVATDAQKLRDRHTIERLQDELEVAEGATLDPKQYAVNAKFQGVKVKRGPGAQWTSVTGSGNLRGRLQNMVPPTGFGNPAPR